MHKIIITFRLQAPNRKPKVVPQPFQYETEEQLDAGVKDLVDRWRREGYTTIEELMREPLN
jgi:hypothetical protein